MPNTAPMSPSTGDAIIPSCRHSTASFTNLEIQAWQLKRCLWVIAREGWLERGTCMPFWSRPCDVPTVVHHDNWLACALLLDNTPKTPSNPRHDIPLRAPLRGAPTRGSRSRHVPAHHAVLNDVLCQRLSSPVGLLVRLDEGHGHRIELLSSFAALLPLPLGVQVETRAGFAAEEPLLHLR